MAVRVRKRKSLPGTVAGQGLKLAQRFAATLEMDRIQRDDVVSEAMLALLDSWPSYRGECSLSTWVYRLVIAARHRLSVRERRAHSLGRAPIAVDHTACQGAADQAPTPGAALEADEEQAALPDLIAVLTIRQREAVSLYYGEGRTTAEIGEIMRISQATVRYHLLTARRCLQQAAKTSAELTDGGSTAISCHPPGSRKNLRGEAERLLEQGLSQAQVSRELSLPKSTVCRWNRLRRQRTRDEGPNTHSALDE